MNKSAPAAQTKKKELIGMPEKKFFPDGNIKSVKKQNEDIEFDKFEGSTAASTAVSYTHLDVYKRQVYRA